MKREKEEETYIKLENRKRRYQRNWGLSWESGDFFDKEEGQNKFHKYIKIDTYIDKEKNVYILDDTNRWYNKIQISLLCEG